MNYQTYLSVVQDSLGTDQEAAERATRAVASVLGERIGADEARVYAAHLPPEVAAWLHTAGGARSFDADEFVRRVGEREGTSPDTAERHIIAVLGAISQALPEREYDHLLARLSKDYAPLLPKAAVPPTMSTRAFVSRVAQRSRIDDASALRVAEAVLETLAERITAGEVRDLTARLPVRLHGPLKRGPPGRTRPAAGCRPRSSCAGWTSVPASALIRPGSTSGRCSPPYGRRRGRSSST
jgi:uncharacterized protein (DUF2267 family)